MSELQAIRSTINNSPRELRSIILDAWQLHKDFGHSFEEELISRSWECPELTADVIEQVLHTYHAVEHQFAAIKHKE